MFMPIVFLVKWAILSILSYLSLGGSSIFFAFLIVYRDQSALALLLFVAVSCTLVSVLVRSVVYMLCMFIIN